jgi:predicted MFS family arabinose efflux permease
MLAKALAPLLAPRLHYAWIVLFVMFVATLCGMGVRAAPGVIIVPLQQAFGWNVATISGAVSLNIFLLGLLAPFMAGFMQSFGLKRTVVSALSLLSLGVLLSTFMTKPWQLYATWGLMVGIGASAGSIGLATAVVNRWFTIHKATAVGIMTSANAAGQLIFLPFLAALAETYGWQAVALTLSLVMASVVAMLLLFLPETPDRVGLTALGTTRATDTTLRGTNPFAVTFGGLGKGVRRLDFWLLAGSFSVCGFSANGLVGTHLIAYCADNGIGTLAAASMLASLGVFSMLGATLSGWLTDRYNPRVVLFFVYGLRGLSLLILPFTDFSPLALIIFAAFYGLDWIATGAPTYALTNEVFGEKDAPVIISWIYTGHQLGGATAAIMAGSIRDATGSYMLAFLLSGIACLCAALLVLRIRYHSAVPARA